MSASAPGHIGFEENLTWEQANLLRSIADEYVDRTLAAKLVAEHHRSSSRAPHENYQRALALQAKVHALFRAVSAVGEEAA
jgi:hypothetical protein